MEQTPNSRINPLTLTSDLESMWLGHVLKFNETSSNGLGDMEGTQIEGLIT